MGGLTELRELSRERAQRWLPAARPLVGGAVGMAIIVGFLAGRGGDPGGPFDAITGTQRGGWNRHEDFHLALVVAGAAGAAVMVTLVTEWGQRWWWVAAAVVAGGVCLLIRETTSVDGAGGAVLLALVFFCLCLAGAVAVTDLRRVRRREH